VSAGAGTTGAWRWAALSALGYVAAGALALAAGAGAVSDDDYARAVIAERFALAPRLDPSGTSWLPFPFWSLGALMRALGPSLEVARAHALGWAAASGALLWAAGRRAGLSPRAAAFGALAPLSAAAVAPLAAAHVPELPTAALATFGLAAAAFGGPRACVAGGVALLAAGLSRYEAWPLAFGAAALMLTGRRGANGAGPVEAGGVGARSEAAGRGVDAERSGGAGRGGRAVGAALAAAGPLLWVAWNRAAHDDALHFARRVAAYHASVARPATTLADALGGYPAALVREAPGLALATAVGLAAGAGLWRRWARPLAVGGALLAGLVAAEARGGAPTHHPERAVLALWCLAGLVVADAGARAWRARRSPVGRVRRAALGAGALGAGALGAAALATRARSWPETLGPSRAAEVELGRALAARVPAGERVLVVPSSYGFFATAAALGRPGDLVALVPRAVDPRSNEGDAFESAASLAAAAERADARWALADANQRPTAEAAGWPGERLSGEWWLYRAGGRARAAP
jgi:hypothetical protein